MRGDSIGGKQSVMKELRNICFAIGAVGCGLLLGLCLGQALGILFIKVVEWVIG